MTHVGEEVRLRGSGILGLSLGELGFLDHALLLFRGAVKVFHGAIEVTLEHREIIEAT